MKDNTVVKKMYPFEKKALSSGKRYKIIMGKPREIEVLSATGNGKEDNNLRVHIKSKDTFDYHLYKEKKLEVTPATPLPNNKRFTLVIPKTDPEPVFNLFPTSEGSLIPLPLKSFIDTQNNNPVKIFMLNPTSLNTKSGMNNDTSYLNELGITSDSNDIETLLFTQELKNPLSLLDGAININTLNDEQCSNIAQEILGPNYEQQVHEEKVKAREGNRFWDTKRGISTTISTNRSLWKHKEILMDFGFKGKFFIKTVKGKQYVVFRGYNGLRKWYTGTRYKATNPKIVNLTSTGKIKSGLKGNAVTIFIVGAIDIVDWLLSEEENKHLSDLYITLGMDILKTIISSIITAGIATFIMTLITMTGMVAPVCVVIVGVITVGIVIGFGLDWLDRKIDATNYIKTKGQEANSFLEDLWQENVVKPIGQLYFLLEKSIENTYLKQSTY